jgi:hypothetical protein
MVRVVTLVPVVVRMMVLPVQFWELSGGRSDGFSSFIVLLGLSLLGAFCALSAGLRAGVVCGGSGSCSHSESVSLGLLSAAKSCLCW